MIRAPKIRILGIDPGSLLTGYGCIECEGRAMTHVTHGTIRTDRCFATGTIQKEISTEKRLLAIFEGLSEVIRTHQPEVVAIEKVFFAKNAVSALKLGQARGVAVLCAAVHGLPVAEYNPTEVKSTVSGFGRAQKEQVARMVELLLGNRVFETYDASDALALAICHALSAGRGAGAKGAQTTQARPSLARKRRKRYSMAESAGLKP